MEVPTTTPKITFNSIELNGSKINLNFDDTDNTEFYEVYYKNLENGSTDTNTFTSNSKQFAYITGPILYKIRACNVGGCGTNYSDSFVVVKGNSAEYIQTAINNLNDSDVENDDNQKIVFVTDGTYTGENYIELKSDTYLLGSDSKPTIRTGILIDGENNVTVENLKVKNEANSRTTQYESNESYEVKSAIVIAES